MTLTFGEQIFFFFFWYNNNIPPRICYENIMSIAFYLSYNTEFFYNCYFFGVMLYGMGKEEKQQIQRHKYT